MEKLARLSPEALSIGAMTLLTTGMTVRILYPHYVVGEIGKIIAKECGTDNWLVQVLEEDILLALAPDEFILMESSPLGRVVQHQ